MSDRAARFDRRLKARRKQQQETGVRVTTPERQPDEDRRVRSMTPVEVDDWLKRNGIFGGDRRKAQRRKR